ncbi:MAG: 50S ribosomal protein L13 [Candidatus Woesearchaeota archaeon]|nr:50S ribosomal protein L13 [Candidatus Woesearchaeota archaeon]
MAEYVIDATDLLVGRLATQAARAALHGKNVKVINCEKAVFSGKKTMIIENWKRKYGMGVPKKGPFIHRFPDKFVRRVIRGMLPYKQPRGRDAFERIMCYIGNPDDAKGETIEGANAEKLPNTRYVRVGVICKELGGKWHE